MLDANCIEVTEVAQVAAVRDSKDPAGPALAFDRAAWASFLGGLDRLAPA